MARVRLRRALDPSAASAGRTSPATEDYIARIGAGEPTVGERRELTSDERLEEALFTGLRLADGIDIEAVGRAIRRGRLGPVRVGPRAVRRRGAAGPGGTAAAADAAGMLLANEIMAVFV